MGNSQLTEQQLLLYKNETQFTTAQIRKSHKKYNQLDQINKGFTSAQDLLSIIQQHKYGPLLVQMLCINKNQEIDFIQLMKVLNIIQFGDKDTLFAKIIDQDRDGLIGVEDLQRAITILNPALFNRSSQLAIQLIESCPQSRDQKISYQQFTNIIFDD